MVRRWVWVIGFLVVSAAVGGAQTYGPGEIYYGGIRLQFSGRLVTAGTCTGPVQPAPGVSEIRCQVAEGSAGTVELTAVRTPAGAVNLRVESVPSGWPSSLWTEQRGQWVDSRSSVASGWAAVTAQYGFTMPTGSAGRSFTLRFKAWTAGVIGELELRVVLEAVRALTPPPTEPTVPPSYGPFTGRTDAAGRFEVPIPAIPNTTVTGTLTECTVRPLPRAQVSVTLVPKAGVTAISRADQIGAVRVSSPGYGEVEVTQLQLLSSMDPYGRVSTTVGLGTVCLRPTGVPVTHSTTYGPISGRTDAEGNFTVTLAPGVTVSGRLTDSTGKPLTNQEFTLTPVPKGEAIAGPDDIAGFRISVTSYQETVVTTLSKFSLFGLTSYTLGDVCLAVLAPPPCTCTNLTVRTGAPSVTGWLHTLELAGEKAWVQVDVRVPVDWTITCGPDRPPSECRASIAVVAAAQFDPAGFVPAAEGQKLWTPALQCWGKCPGDTELPGTRYVRYSFIVEARQVIGPPLAEVLPYKGTITFTLTPICPGSPNPLPPVLIVVPVGVGVPGGVPLNPNPPPPPPPLPPVLLPIDPSVPRDPYVREIESVEPLSDGAAVLIRLGNRGREQASVRLAVTVILEDGTEVVQAVDDLELPAGVEFTVQVVVPLSRSPSGQVWPPVQAVVAEIVPQQGDSDLDNNRVEWP